MRVVSETSDEASDFDVASGGEDGKGTVDAKIDSTSSPSPWVAAKVDSSKAISSSSWVSETCVVVAAGGFERLFLIFWSLVAFSNGLF